MDDAIPFTPHTGRRSVSEWVVFTRLMNRELLEAVNTSGAGVWMKAVCDSGWPKDLSSV